jgi:hypothetical protein
MSPQARSGKCLFLPFTLASPARACRHIPEIAMGGKKFRPERFALRREPFVQNNLPGISHASKRVSDFFFAERSDSAFNCKISNVHFKLKPIDI